MKIYYWEFKKQVKSIKTEMLVNCMMKAFKLKNDLKNLSNLFNLISIMNVLNTVAVFDQLLNLHLNALKYNMMLFKKIVKLFQMCINTQTLMNFDVLMIYVLDEIVQKLRKYIKKKLV